MLDILKNGGFGSPIIVFVNQKKTADMVARDISRAGVRLSSIFSLTELSLTRYHPDSSVSFSGVRQLYIPARLKNSVKLLYRLLEAGPQIFLLLPILLDVVSMCRTSHWSSTTKWRILLRLTFIVLVCILYPN